MHLMRLFVWLYTQLLEKWGLNLVVAMILCHNYTFLCAELRDLLNELQEVTDWFFLGLCLGLFESQLEVIKQDHKTNDERRREVLATWARQEKPTWSKVVCALMEMGDHQVLASQIAEKYGISFC